MSFALLAEAESDALLCILEVVKKFKKERIKSVEPSHGSCRAAQ
jgi:hypothetical protein